jgi:AraC family transcriptional regulator
LLNETVYLGGSRVPAHSHKSGYFCLVRKGSYTEAFGGKQRVCHPLTFAFHPPEELHSERFESMEARSFNIEIANDWLTRMSGEVRLDNPAEFTGTLAASLALRLYREFQLLDPMSNLAIEGLMLEIVAAASRLVKGVKRPSIPPWLARVRQILHDRFLESLSLTEIGSLVEIHPVHIAASFRRCYGVTLGQYARQLRLEYACGQLVRSNKPLSEVAAICGYADQSHLSRTFKQAFGVTPSEYRIRRGLN